MLNPAFSIFLVYGLVALAITAVVVQRLLCCLSNTSETSADISQSTSGRWRALMSWSRVGILVLSYGTMCDNFRQFAAAFNLWPTAVLAHFCTLKYFLGVFLYDKQMLLTGNSLGVTICTQHFQIVEAANDTIATAAYANLYSACTEACAFMRFQTYISWQGEFLHIVLSSLSVSFFLITSIPLFVDAPLDQNSSALQSYNLY